MDQNSFLGLWVSVVINTFVGAVISVFVPWLNALFNFIVFDEEHLL